MIKEIEEKIRRIEKYLPDLNLKLKSSNPAEIRRAKETLEDLNQKLSNAGAVLFWIKGERI